MGSVLQGTIDGVSVVIPCFNEENAIVDTLDRLRNTFDQTNVNYEIIVVDDGSQDASAKLLREYKSDNLQIVTHPVNIGYGASLKDGILKSKYETIGIIDADGTYKVEAFPELIGYIERGFDLVIATRTNIAETDSFLKGISRKIFKFIIRFLVNKNIEDPNSGLRVFRKSVVMEAFPFLCDTFSFTTSMTILIVGKRHFVKHVPVNYSPRKGSSKVNHFRDTIRALQMIVQGVTFFNPIKFFILLSAFMVGFVCIPSMVIATLGYHVLSLYAMIFGSVVILLIALGTVGDIVRVSMLSINERKISQEMNN